MRLAPHIRALGRGPGRTRGLTLAEAEDAMRAILAGEAAPEAVGALLMLMRLRGESPEEVAGFTRALVDHAAPWQLGTDLDWPTYAAGRSRGSPLFVLAARLVALAGYKVVLHGLNSHQGAVASVRAALPGMGIEIADTQAAAARALAHSNIVYLPLEILSKPALELLELRAEFGLRSCFNTVLRLWNPTRARVSVQGVFHPSYRGLQSQVSALMQRDDMMVIKGGGGEFERHPAKAIAIYGRRASIELDETAPALLDETRRLHEPGEAVDLSALWQGAITDEFASATVTGTAALALWALGARDDLGAAQTLADQLWQDRPTSLVP